MKSLVCCGCFPLWPVHLGAWPGGSWLPWRAAPLGCFAVWFDSYFFFVASAFRPVWPGRCIWALSVYRSRLAPWTRGESNHGKLSALRPLGHGRYRFATASALFGLIHRDFHWNGPIFRFTFSPAQWASPQLNGPVQLSSDRDSWLTGPYWPEGRRRKKRIFNFLRVWEVEPTLFRSILGYSTLKLTLERRSLLVPLLSLVLASPGL